MKIDHACRWPSGSHFLFDVSGTCLLKLFGDVVRSVGDDLVITASISAPPADLTAAAVHRFTLNNSFSSVSLKLNKNWS